MAPMVQPLNVLALPDLASLNIRLSLEYLTPELAARYLANRAANRPINRAQMLKYARDMLLGCWGIDGSTLVFNLEDRMTNGQHRCGAVVHTGVTIIVCVVRGIDDREFVHMDTGLIRTMAQVLAVDGEQAATTLAGALRLLYLYNRDLLSMPYPISPTHDELEQELQGWPLVRHSLEVRSWCRYQISPATTVFFHFLFARDDQEAANLFMMQLGRGENLAKGMPVYALREKIAKQQKSKSRLVTREVYAWIIKAWNAFIQGKSLSRLSWSPHLEPFPAIVGRPRSLRPKER